MIASKYKGEIPFQNRLFYPAGQLFTGLRYGCQVFKLGIPYFQELLGRNRNTGEGLFAGMTELLNGLP
jgi:hypothetical protein